VPNEKKDQNRCFCAKKTFFIGTCWINMNFACLKAVHHGRGVKNGRFFLKIGKLCLLKKYSTGMANYTKLHIAVSYYN